MVIFMGSQTSKPNSRNCLMRNNEKYKAIYLLMFNQSLMRKGIVLILPLVSAMLSALTFVALDSAVAQNKSTSGNMTNVTTGGNVTGGNMTASDTSSSPAKFHLEEGIKALQGGDTTGAMTHLTAAEQAMSNAPPDAIRHFEEGMKALDSGDNNGAIMHLNIANEALG